MGSGGAPFSRARASGTSPPVSGPIRFSASSAASPGGPASRLFAAAFSVLAFAWLLGPRPATRKTGQNASLPFQARARGLDPAYAFLPRSRRRRPRCRRSRPRGRSELILGRPRAGARLKRGHFLQKIFSGSRLCTAYFAHAAFCFVFASSPFAVFLARPAARRL